MWYRRTHFLLDNDGIDSLFKIFGTKTNKYVSITMMKHKTTLYMYVSGAEEKKKTNIN